MKTILYLLLISFPSVIIAQSNLHPKENDSPGINLGPDFNLCPGLIHQLDAGPGYDSYLWQDGSTEQTYMVTEGGEFWVHAFFGSTMYADTIQINYWPSPDPNLGNDTLLCQGNSLILEPTSNFADYLWHDGSTLPFYLVTGAGLYWVTVTDVHGCTASDSIWIEYSDFEIDLGMDTVICLCDSVLLNAGDGFQNYEWQDGSTDQFFLVVAVDYGVGSHEFSVTAIDSNNCLVSDSKLIYIDGFTGLDAEYGSKFHLFPNPAKERLYIRTSDRSSYTYTISIFDAMGVRVYQAKKFNSFSDEVFSVETAGLKNGIYTLSIEDRMRIETRKFIVNH